MRLLVAVMDRYIYSMLIRHMFQRLKIKSYILEMLVGSGSKNSYVLEIVNENVLDFDSK